MSLLVLAGREPWLLSGKAQEEGDGSGGTAAPALLDFTGDKNEQAEKYVSLAISSSVIFYLHSYHLGIFAERRG